MAVQLCYITNHLNTCYIAPSYISPLTAIFPPPGYISGGYTDITPVDAIQPENDPTWRFRMSDQAVNAHSARVPAESEEAGSLVVCVILCLGSMTGSLRLARETSQVNILVADSDWVGLYPTRTRRHSGSLDNLLTQWHWQPGGRDHDPDSDSDSCDTGHPQSMIRVAGVTVTPAAGGTQTSWSAKRGLKICEICAEYGLMHVLLHIFEYFWCIFLHVDSIF